jgi:hypothetical protein
MKNREKEGFFVGFIFGFQGTIARNRRIIVTAVSRAAASLQGHKPQLSFCAQ